MIRRLGWSLVVGRREPTWRTLATEIGRIAALREDALAARTATVLAAHLRWAATTIPFHRARVAPDAPLGDFPILDRATIQREREALRDPTRPKEALREETSGGSTGEPVRLWNDADYAAWTFATEVHVLGTWGLKPWCRRAFLWGDDREQQDIGWKERVARRVHPSLFLNAFEMDDARMASFADRIDAFRPELVQGYATALDLFASYLLRSGRRPAHPVAVRSSAEALSAEARARVEAAFGAPVRDFYGSRESSSLAAQCAPRGLPRARPRPPSRAGGRGRASGAPRGTGPGPRHRLDESRLRPDPLRQRRRCVVDGRRRALPLRLRLSATRSHPRPHERLPDDAVGRAHPRRVVHPPLLRRRRRRALPGPSAGRRPRRRLDRGPRGGLGRRAPARADARAPRAGGRRSLAPRRGDPADTSGKHRFTLSDVPYLGGRS